MFKRFFASALTLILVFLLTLWAGCRGLFAGSSIDDPMVNGRPECPRHDSLFVDSSGVWVPRDVQIAGSGVITTIPEYHDCQRLRVGSSPRRYGPLIAIFARIDLGNLGDPVGFVPLPSPSGSGVPDVSVPPQAGGPTVILTPGTRTGAEQSVATILNYDATYPPLHIQSGYNCLYVYHGPVGSKLWLASIVKATTDQDCLKPLSSWPDPTPLNVQPTYDPRPAPVARWDWDKSTGEHYIGIQCGSSWCEVWNHAHATLGSSKYFGMGKGWYDEQYLAERLPLWEPIPMT